MLSARRVFTSPYKFLISSLFLNFIKTYFWILNFYRENDVKFPFRYKLYYIMLYIGIYRKIIRFFEAYFC